MRSSKPALPIAAACVAVAIAGSALPGCSSSDSPTTPTPGTGTGFNSGNITAPGDYVRTFAAADTIGYHCNIHVSMGMVGTVRVANGGADSAVVTASGIAFSPSTVTIKPGGYVHWKITGGTHTVTSD